MEPNPELTEIEQQIKDLQEKKRLLLEEEAKKLRRVVINIHKLNTNTGKVYFTLSNFRADVVDYMRYNMQRAYDGTNNIVSITNLDTHIAEIEKLGDVEIIWSKDSSEKWNEYKNAPDIAVDIDDKRSAVILKLGPKLISTRLYLSNSISTLTIDIYGMRFSIAEFHLFPDSIKSLYPDYVVSYSDRAKEILLAQLERQRILSELANAKDAPDIPNPFLKYGKINPKTGEVYDLKPHQRVAVKFIEVSGGNGIISYDMGTGKTVIGLGLAERMLERKEAKRILIICPANLKTNWRRMISDFTGKTANVFSGIEPDGLAIDTWVEDKYEYHIINYDIIGRRLKGEDTVMKWILLFNTVKPDLVIPDEGHYIKNMDSNRSKGVLALNGEVKE